MQVEATAELKNQNNNDKQDSSRAGSRFGRAIKGFLILDAAFILFLTSGFVLPRTPLRDANTGGLPENYYDYSAKVSPLTAPVPEPKQPKTEIETITARGDHPTFVPPAADDSGENYFDGGKYGIPASITASDTAADSPHSSEFAPPGATPAGVVPVSVRREPNESPTTVPGARVETVAVHHTSY